MDEDASSSVGVAFALLLSFLSESVNDMLAQRVVAFRDDCERGVWKGSISRGGDLLSDGDIDNKPYGYQPPDFV